MSEPKHQTPTPCFRSQAILLIAKWEKPRNFPYPLVAGRFAQTLEVSAALTLTAAASFDTFIAKFDSTGALLWGFSLGGNGDDVPQALALDSADALIVSGTIRVSADLDPGPGDFTVMADTDEDSFVAKYTTNGDFMWGHLFEQLTASGIAQSDSAQALVVDPTDQVYVAGQYEGTVDFGPVTLDATGTDAYIALIDAGGVLQWVSSTQSSGLRTEHFALGQDMAGNLYAAGIYFGDTDFDPDPVAEANGTSDNSLDLYVASYTASGDFRWVQFITGSGTELVSDIYVRSDGTFTLAGQYGGTTDFDPGPDLDQRTAGGQFDIWFAHFDATGAVLGAHTLTGSGLNGRSGIEAIAPTTDGDLIVAGQYRGPVDFDPGPGSLDLLPAGAHDAFVGRYTALRPDPIFMSGFEEPAP